MCRLPAVLRSYHRQPHPCLLNKSKIPFGLTITPYHSLEEGEKLVPLVMNTMIGRCRRHRAYINPYVQLMDSGNQVSLTRSLPLEPMLDTIQLAVLHVLYVE